MKSIKIKLITVSLIIISIAVIAKVGFSKALFEDTETLETNIVMGSLDLQVVGENQATIPLDFENMVPGEVRKVLFLVNNIGTVPGNFWVRGELLESIDGENPGEDPENLFTGDLHECARLVLARIRSDGGLDLIINDELLQNINQDYDAAAYTMTDAAINNGSTEMEIWISTLECDNETMGDSIKANLELYLTQNEPDV